MSSKRFLVNPRIHTSSSPILFISRLFGLAPLNVQNVGLNFELSFSLGLTLYSCLLAAVLTGFALYGMVQEYSMGDHTVRMRGNTSRYVTCVDMILVQVILLLGVINIPLQIKKLYLYMKHIIEIDSLVKVTDTAKARAVSIRSLSLILTGTVLLLCYDLYVWYSSASGTGDSFTITNYVAYHCSYIICIVLQCQYSHLGYCLKRRLKLINDNLENTTLQKFIDGHGVLVKANGGPYQEESILDLLRAYQKICDAVEIINGFFGHIVLVIIVACLMNLTINPYFIIVELSGRCDLKFLSLYVLWFLARFFQLILVVEPCNICFEQTKAASAIICRLLSCEQTPEGQREQLELFFAQLVQRRLEFSALGLGSIDRSLVTSMAAAVTVYLVTILQFRNAGST